MNKIDIIPWNDSFNTGIEIVDQQHKKLVDIINNLATQFAYNSNSIDINNIFNELIDYTNYHFNSEETIWNKYINNKESEIKHQKIHKNFIQELKKLIKKAKNSTIEEIAENILDFLVQWLVSHILESDRFMAYKVMSLKKGKSYEEAYKEAQKRMDGNTKKLTSLVMSMYKVLSTNTLKLLRESAKQQKLKDELEAKKNELETIFNYAKDGIAIIDFETNFLNFNKAFLEMTGYTKKELLNKSSNELTILEHRDRNQDALEQVIKTGHSKDFEKDYIVNGNRKITVSISMSLLPDKKRILLTLKNISTLKIMEQQARLASMGEMIGNIAHQWRQPLSVITTSASGIKLESEFGEITKEYINETVEIIMKQSNYLSNTIDNFRNFIKGENIIQEVFLKDVIEISLNLIAPSLKHNYINLILDIEDDGKIFGNKNELSEAFINILNNAKDALKQNIKKENDRLIFISTKKLDSNKIQLSICDSGQGISEDIIDKIFDPYFTTKHQYQGTGLGLSMSQNIIDERHKGKIVVFNKQYKYNKKEYKGACFNITFDLID
ncbi:MAG: bacteriohemerythrin [Halarcobacter sp.]